MTIRWYLLPIETIGNARGPKYMRRRVNPDGIDATRAIVDYGLMPWCIMWADVTPAQHAELISHADVRHIVAHSNIDNAIGSAAPTVRSVLEAGDIPGTWVQSTDTWRQVLRGIFGMFLLAQRVHGRYNVTLLPDGYTLDTTWAELPQGAKAILLDTAMYLGLDISQGSPTTTLRQIYRVLGNTWGEQEGVFKLGQVTI